MPYNISLLILQRSHNHLTHHKSHLFNETEQVLLVHGGRRVYVSVDLEFINNFSYVFMLLVLDNGSPWIRLYFEQS